jgi:hypothetical protein
MKTTEVSFPQLAMVAGTRMALGLGLGFLLADKIEHAPRRAAGWALLLVGLISTIPLALEVFGGRARR